ncbi:MAG: hypothetical protein Q8P22_02285, partial [Chloroflexota bacterium]|nr:hypothetical protein [Chloroflexota bacterium]
MSQVLTQIRTSMEDRGFPRDWVESLPLLVNDLESLKVQNIAGWLREVKSRLDEKEQYLDVWAQGWFAWAFAFNGFAMTMNPSGSIGPDLLVKVRSQDIFVEVRRFRTDYEERKRLEEGGPDGELVPYGDFSKDVRRVLGAVQAKSRQGKGIPDGSSYMVAIR